MILKRFIFSFTVFIFCWISVTSIANASGEACYTFPRNLKMTDRGIDVWSLQKFLNTDPRTQISQYGVGSPGKETDYFGLLTAKAVSRFQELYSNETLLPAGLTSGTGFFGIASRLKVLKICLEGLLGQGAVPLESTQLPVAQNTSIPTASSQSVTLNKGGSVNDYVNKFIVWYQIAGSIPSTPENKLIREVGWFPPTPEYWNNFANRIKNNEMQIGVKRIVLWSPFGFSYDSPEPIQFDQYLNAQVDTPWLVNNFVNAWKPITQSGVEVIAYIGSPYIDEKQVALINNQSAWWDRAWSAVKPFKDAGMSIAFDAVVGQSESSMDYQLAEALRNQGVKVYVESRPRYNLSHWNQSHYGVFIDNYFFYRSDPERYADASVWQAVKNSDLKGETIRMVLYENGPNLPSDVPSDYIGQAKSVLKEGDSVAIGGTLVNASTPLSSFLPTGDSYKIITLQGSDPDGGTLTFSITSNPQHGTLTQTGSGGKKVKYKLTSSSFVGTDYFTYTVSDGLHTSLPATVSIQVKN